LLGLQTFLIALMFIVNIFFIIYYHSWYSNRIFASINKFISQYIFLFFVVALAIIYLSSIFCTITIYNYRLNLDLWSYTGIWNIDLENSPYRVVFDIIWWVIFIMLLVVMIIYDVRKHVHISDLTFTSLPAFTLLLFINPLSLNLWSKVMQYGYGFDLNTLNFVVVIPMLISLANMIDKVEYFHIKKNQHLYE
jgi:hypothetical protein